MNPRKLVWSEGLFIRQHHLQQLDRYHERQLTRAIQSVRPYCFGVTVLELDERALSNGQLVVSILWAVMPDGTPVSVGADESLPPRAVESAFGTNRASLPVYVSIPHESETRANVDFEQRANTEARYTRQTFRVSDFNDGGQEQELAWGRPNLRIMFGGEPHESYASLQIAELIRSPAGQVLLRDTYVPPVLRISASPFLMAGFRRILTGMTARQRSLAASRRQRTDAQVEFQASDASKYWLLNVLNESIPLFSHLVDTGSTHPEQAYLALAELIGKLSTFAADGDPTQIPKFNFLALGDVFEPMFARALALLDAVIAERYQEIPLRLREDGMYLGKVEDANVLRHELFLAASGSMPEADVRDRLPKLSKIASWGQIGSLLNSAVNGVRIDLEYRPPGALPVRPGLVFFKVTRTPEYWPDIQGTGTIAIYHPFQKDALSLSLYAVDPRNL